MIEPQTTTFWWVRHAPVPVAHGHFYDHRQVDCDCSDTSRFAGLAKTLPKKAVWVVSDMKRTHQTAAAIFNAGYTPQILNERANTAEQHFGDWLGQPFSIAFSQDFRSDDFWMHMALLSPPNGETFQDLLHRTASAVEGMLATYVGKNVIVVSHSGVIRAAIAHALSLSASAAAAVSIDNLSLTCLQYERRTSLAHSWRLLFSNRLMSV